MAGGSRSSASVNKVSTGAAPVPGPAGVAEPWTVDAAPLCVRAEHHLGMRGKILVDLHDAAAQVPTLGVVQIRGSGLGIREGWIALGLFAGLSVAPVHGDLDEVRPGRPRWRLAFGAALEHQHVDNHLRAGRRVHDALRQAHGADQVGEARDVLACHGAGLVHRAGAADEQRDAARPEACDRAGDEVVVEPQAERGRGGVCANDAVRERRIADHQIKTAGEVAAGVVLAAYAGFRMDEAGNPGRHRIVFDAGELRCTAQCLGQQGEEQAGAHAGLEHAAAGEAETLSGVPQRPDNALGCVVGILRRTLQGRILGGRHRVGEITPDRFPPVAVSGRSGQRKAVLSELGGAEAHKAQQLRLLLRGRRTARSLDLLGQADRRDVVARAGGPAACERAVAVEDIVAAVRDWPGFARR